MIRHVIRNYGWVREKILKAAHGHILRPFRIYRQCYYRFFGVLGYISVVSVAEIGCP